MAQGTNMPAPWFTGLDDSGRPLAGGRLYTYLAGSDTLLPTYSDAGLTTANANPVVLDAGGRAAVYLGPYAYKFILNNASDVLVKQQDVVSAVAPFSLDTGISSVAGESLAAGKAAFLSDGSGGRTAGRWYLTDADDTAMSTTPVSVGVVSAQILIGQTGSIQIGGRATGLSGLTAGTAYYLSATPGGLTSTPPTNARLVGVADSTTSLVLADSTGQIPASRVAAGSFGAGDFTFVGGMRAYGAHASASATLANPGVISFETPVTRIYTGDGTGYSIEFAKRGSSVTTRLVRINETGLTVEINGGLNVGGTTDPGDNNLRVEGTTHLSNGTYTAPALAFASEPNLGLYRNAANDLRVACLNSDVMALGPTVTVYKHTYFESNITANALGTATTGTDLVISASNAIRPKSSSRRYKEHERAWDGNPRDLLALAPKTFDYKGDGAKGVLFFIAEDVAAIDPLYVNTNADGAPESIRTDSLVAALVALAQQQDARLAALEARQG